jgi:hypothetical protein
LKEKIFGLITAESDINKIISSNKILLNSLSLKFKKIYVINLYNLKLFTKKYDIKKNNLPNFIIEKNFQNYEEFKVFAKDKKIVSLIFLGKDLTYFKIYYILKKFNIRLIMVMYLSQIGNKPTADLNFKYLFKAYKLYFYKGFYRLFRILTILNIFPKVDILFESNLNVINFIKNSRSRRVEKIIPKLNLSYFKEVVPVNSIYFDKLKIFNKNKIKKKNQIVYIDTHINHFDREIREGKINNSEINFFYNNLKNFFKNISTVYKMPIIICKHPKNNLNHIFYKNFKISELSTDEEVANSEIVIFCLSSAILNAVLLKKKIININSKYLGDYMSNINRQYVEELGLVSINIDKKLKIIKKELDSSLENSIKNYDNYIKNKLNADGTQMASKKITEFIYKKYF